MKLLLDEQLRTDFIYLKNYLFYLFLFCCAINISWATTPPCDSIQSQGGVITPLLRKPTEKQLNKFREQKQYQYGQDFVTPITPWQRFMAWLSDKFSRLLVRTSKSGYGEIITYIFIALIAIFVILKILGVDVSLLWKKTAKSYLPLEYQNISENIHEIDFNVLINEAIENRNFRLAVRLLYLNTLKKMSDAALIEWQPTKTNRNYLYELKGKYPQFESLTRQFEYVWYGDFQLNENDFKEVKNDFLQFNTTF